MSITFDYDAVDGTTELVPDIELLGTPATPEMEMPFDLKRMRTLLIQSRIYGYKNNEYTEAANLLSGVLWMILMWFRREGTSATELKRLVDTYPDRYVSPNQDILNAVKAQINPDEYSNP